MVQGYTQANTPNPSGWCSIIGIPRGYFRRSNTFQSISSYSLTNSVFMEDSEKNRYIEILILQKEERDRTTDYENMLPMTISLCKVA